MLKLLKEEKKLLGTIITNDLKWEANTSFLVRKANSRMQLLGKCVTFTKKIEELRNIYIIFIRSNLEQSCVLWHSSLTLEDSNNLERVQKSSLRIILQEDYEDYEKILQQVNLQSLYERRISLCKNVATNTARQERLHTLFPHNYNNPLSKT